jgi:hypothetical protein
VTIKEMRSGDQIAVNRVEMRDYISELLGTKG